MRREDDHPKEHCAIFGIFGNRRAAWYTFLGLYAQQHRGEESAGIASSNGKEIRHHKSMGLVSEVFDESSLDALKGHLAIGHCRYSTTGSSLAKNAQPIIVDYSRGTVAIGHNGNITNAEILRAQLEAHGAIFQTTTDSEIVIHLMAKPTYNNRIEGLKGALKRLEGAYSLVLMWEDELVGVRDPYGFRPLSIGKIRNAYVLASETCAFDLIGAKFVREVAPGEIVIINKNGLKSIKPFPEPKRKAYCIFEHVYFARPDSLVFGENVHNVRKRLGKQLAIEHPVEADIVIPIPDSGNSAAIGYSSESGIPQERGMIRNHYVGRTFIQPHQFIRDLAVKIKLNSVGDALKGKRIVVVDDSIVRGTTSKMRMRSIRESGAKEIHLRVSGPPHKHPCFYGIDFPSKDELIASKRSVEEIRKFLGVDSIGYLSLEGLLGAVSFDKKNYCTACYSGDYPVRFDENVSKFATER
ncbi:MAG: amidophosphoribosyltransferase [Candidatus Omnitrophica bacterium CG1_02_49_10]|nr:MAG: amidophosphoribosyltransferase [Candidatus Omnitrophica bacterium CG1_02_49_10]